jgi:hypothetical protein
MDEPFKVDGSDSFMLGVNSFAAPQLLQNGEYVMGMNLINRGGIAQTRPGSASLPFNIPGNNIQGITMFKPTFGPAALVFMVDGLVYASYYPFKSYIQIAGLKFSKYSKYAAWASCVQSTDYTDDGTLINLPTSKAVLIIQDGFTRAAYWDGNLAAHINPTPSQSEFTIPDRDGTPGGLWMKWSNNRLWVSQNDHIYASDIGNPLKFTETQYLNEARSFHLPGKCTGIAETSDQQGIICFTEESGVFLKTSIQDRTLWLSTPEFQKTIMPNVGCTSPRSIIEQHGLIWWWTPKGLINLDDAVKLNISSRIVVQDQQMLGSKQNVSHDVSGVCGGFYENFVLYAVPNGDKLNTRIHVMDQAPSEDGPLNSWCSYWEGWRPVEFAGGVISSQERLFTISRDYDNVIRIWELFKPDKTDNGIPITCWLETRLHLFGDRDYKRFRYAEVELVNISGEVAVMIAAAATKGAYQKVGLKDISATNGQIYYDAQYGFQENDLYGSRHQTRIIRSKDGSDPSNCNEECVESDKRGLVSKGFSLLIAWSGAAGIQAYRIFAQNHPDAYQGICEDDETGEIRLLTTDGCSSREEISESTSLERFIATATFSKVSSNTGQVTTKQSTQVSLISQADATRKAERTAKWYVFQSLGEFV